MRKYVKILIIMVMMIMPLYVKGSTYTAEQGNAEEYLKRSNYVNTYSRYLINNNESPYNTAKIPFGFSNGQIKEVAGFSSAGFISKEEYELTIDKKLYGTGKEVSYLNEGMGFWTIDKEGNQAYAVNNRGKVVLVSQEASNYGRATEYVKSETKISGIGTKSQPFTFDPIYRVTVKTISKKAKIERTIAKENERSACNKSQSDCSEDFGYVRGNCRQDDCTIEVKYSTTDGYVYMTDDCGGVNNSYRNTISISNVDRDTVCNVTFGIGRYKITLKNEDIKGDKAENEVEPDEIYLKYNTGFYTDYEFLSQIRRLTTLPVKEGRRFDGYVNRDKTIWLINKDGVINQEAKDKITTNSEFFIEWYHNKYNIRYVPGHETVVLGTSSPALGIYDDDTALKIDPPSRQGYNFAGWTVQGIDVTTARYGTSSGSVNTKFNKDGQTLAPNATYFYNLNQTDGAMVTFTATWTPRNDTIFTVNRWKQKVDVQSEEKNTTNYDLDVKTYTGTSDQDKQAPQDTFTGFTSISPVGEVFVKYDGSGYIDYYYRRNKVKLSFYMNGGTMQSNKGSAISTNGDLIRISSKDYRPWNYGQIVNLPQWNDSTYINVRKTGYTPVEGKEWCTAADGSETCYNMETDYTSLNAFCDASSGDCSKSLYINWKATVYNIKYLLNNGTHTSTPKTGTYDKVVTIESPTKKITITGNKNGTGATIGEPASADQTFAGWTATGLDTSTAKYGSTTETTSSWSNGSTKVKSKYFKNLRSTTGDVNLTANWTAVNITVPTVTKPGYECEWNTKQDKTGDRIASGGAYVPKSTDPTAITIYAFCTPNPYKIEYNKNNGTLGNPSPTTATYDEAVNIAYPTRAGYVFSGWTGETNLNTSTALYGTSSTSITTTWSNASTVVKRNYFKNLTPTKNQTVKLKAEWGPIVYNVDYNLVNGSYGTNHPTSIKYDETKQINNPTKRVTVSGNTNGSGATIATATYADQTFAGWTADSELNTTTAKTGSSSSSVTTTWSNGNTKVTTEWFKNLRNTEGTVKLTANWTAVRVKTPKVSKTGYDCWYNTSSNETGTRIESEGYYTPTSDSKTSITVYAFCKAKQYTVTLNNQGATTAGTTTIKPTYDLAMPSITVPAKTFTITFNYNGNGTSNTTSTSTYTFGGYYDQTGGNGTQYLKENGTSARTWNKASDSTLYAKWTNGSVTLPSPTRSGYSLDGWYTSASGGTKRGAGGATYNPSQNETLYAHWVACGPGYYLNGNTCTKCAKNKYSTGTANASCTSCKDGYTTSGEGSSAKTDCKITCAANTTVKTADSKCESCATGYGRSGNETVSEGNVGTTCSAIKYTISYTLDGGTVSPANPTEYYVTSNAFTLKNPTKSGFSFTGWTGTGLSSATATVTIAKGSTGNRSYTATWKDTEKPTCTISVTTSGVSMTYSDNVGVSNYGLTTSNSANYNSKKTASLAAGTFYGWVKDAAGNTNSCQKSVEATKATKWTATKQTCGSYTASYNCSTDATANYYYDSYYYTVTRTTCNGTPKTYTCSRTAPLVCPSGYTDIAGTCTRWVAATVGSYYCPNGGSLSGSTCWRTVYNGALGSPWTCYKQTSVYEWNCYYTASPRYKCNSGTLDGSQCKQTTSKVRSCSTCGGTLTGTSCYKYGQTSQVSGWTCNASTYNYSTSSSSTNSTSCKSSTNYSSCNNSSAIGVTNISCSSKWCQSGYSPGTNSCYKFKNYSCSSGTLSGSKCVQNGVANQITGWSCTGNTGYKFTSSSLTNQTSCSTGTAPSCSSSSHSGNNYISACTATEYSCKTSGYTKLNDSWCYK